jgi:hypothetical protein
MLATALQPPDKRYHATIMLMNGVRTVITHDVEREELRMVFGYFPSPHLHI